MATQTKLELQQINSRLATENTELRARVSQLEGDLERSFVAMETYENEVHKLEGDVEISAYEAASARTRVRELKEDILRITECASAVNKAKTRPAYTPPQWQIDRAEQMAKAKALAMASGKSVCI